MFSQRVSNTPLLLGLVVGLVFGSVNSIFTWLDPLEDDTPGVLLRFYGPMFFVWALASFRAARRSGRLLSGVTAGMVVAFATFCVFDVLVLLRVNLSLDRESKPGWRVVWNSQPKTTDWVTFDARS